MSRVLGCVSQIEAALRKAPPASTGEAVDLLPDVQYAAVLLGHPVGRISPRDYRLAILRVASMYDEMASSQSVNWVRELAVARSAWLRQLSLRIV